MKAINLFAGTGTLTRAFQNQGAEVIWAHAETAEEAEIYSCNFPEIPLYQGELSSAVDKIPSHDILLASLSPVGLSSAGKHVSDQYNSDGSLLSLIGSILSEHRPGAVCIVLSALQMLRKDEEILELLIGEKYQYTYHILEKEQHGGIPVRGKKAYLIGFRKDRGFPEFQFPAPCEHAASIEELWRAEEQKEAYYNSIPGRYKELLSGQELIQGKLYEITARGLGKERRLELRTCTSCPALTTRNYRDVFVRDSRGIRNLTAEEYLQLLGDNDTILPSGMSRSRIWKALSKIGVYAIEKRLAAQLLEALGEIPERLPETSLQENLADYLLQAFEIFQFKKRAGLLCMPPGLGKTEVLKHLILKMQAQTGGERKIIILSAYKQTVQQIIDCFRTAEIQAHPAVSEQEIHQFLMNEEQILITSYQNWFFFIEEFQPEGFHADLILIGIDPEDGWKQLTGTREYLPQIIYTGITSVMHSGAVEIFGHVRYSYSIARAVREKHLVPVSVEGEDWEQGGNREQEENRGPADAGSGEGAFALADRLWEDLISHREKTVLIAETAAQAEWLHQELDRRCRNTGEDWQVYLCSSFQNGRIREEQLSGFRSSAIGKLITVKMWRLLSDPDISRIYILGKAEDYSLPSIIGLAAKKFTGKSFAHLVIPEQNLREEARILLGQEEDYTELCSFCDHLLGGEYEKAEKSYNSLLRRSKKLAGQLKRELGIPENFREQTEGLSGKSLVRLWLLLSKAAKPWQGLKKNEQTEEAAENEPAEELKGEASGAEESSLTDKKEKQYKNSFEKGQALEQPFLALLNRLFTWERVNAPREASAEELEFLQKKPSGIQNGRDLELVYTDETGQRRYCYFECKSVETKALNHAAVLAKILEAQRSAREEIEHWILVAPNCRLDSYSVELFEEAERRHRFYPPIKNIQVWNTENQIRELMGLEPELYEQFFGKPVRPEEDPANWSEDTKWRIIQKWKKKLMPVLMLPEGLSRYPFEPERLMFDLQNDPAIRRQYEELFLRRSRLKFYGENGTLSQEYLEEDTIRWLDGGSARVRVVLGEFGDGKTFFLYCLCRRLLDAFVKNPRKNYLPICMSLKNLVRAETPEAFIERRMKELACGYADFLELKEKFHVLVCLDGFDEISSVIDSRTIFKNIRLLGECTELMANAKILITSRTQCFGQKGVKEWLDERAGGLETLTLAPVEAGAREEFLLSGIQEEIRIEKQERLSMDKKLFALMGKPFFLDMMGQLLASGEWAVKSSVSIYEHYIRECLRRKFDRSFTYKEDMLLSKKETVDQIYEALCTMAYVLWNKGQETLSVREFEKHLGKSTAEVLWKEKNPDENEKEDADHRFSMRTLFQYAGDNKVKFSHRSIQEYFAAVHLRRILMQNSGDFETALKEHYFNDEILRFLAELLTENKEDWEELRPGLIRMAENAADEESRAADGKSLPGKLMQLFYFTGRRIPKADWRGKNLSGVDIPGADLSGQNLSGACFANANLNNVCLNDCDCSYCDMTGARMEETSPVLAVRYRRGKLYCLYQDGSLREWEVRQQEETAHIVQIPLLETACIGEHGEIFTQSRDELKVSGIQNGEAVLMQEYRKHRGRSLLSVLGQMALIKEMQGERAGILLVHMQDYRIVKEWSVEKEGSGILTGGGLAVIFDGRGTIELFSAKTRDGIGAFTLELPGAVITFDASVQGDTIELAAGCSSGDIFVYSCRQGTINLTAQGRQQGLRYTALCGNQSLAAVDGDGAVHMMHWKDGEKQLQQDPSETMKLGIYCRNIKTEGLIPKEVQIRLRERSQRNIL